MASWICSYCHGQEYNICIACVKAYIADGTDLNAQDEEGNTALHYVQSPELAQILISAGADPNIVNNRHEKANTFLMDRRGDTDTTTGSTGSSGSSGSTADMAEPYSLNETTGMIEIFGKPFVQYVVKKGRIEFRNPLTTRYVLLDGKTGQLIIKDEIMKAMPH